MFPDDALLLIGHGSTRYPDAGDAMRRHADVLRASGQFARVEIGLLNGAPSVADALIRIGPMTVRVVPFFMEDGYFSSVAVPRALGDQPGQSGERGASGFTPTSWPSPGLTRPPTACGADPTKVVGGRAKLGHDGGVKPDAPSSGHPPALGDRQVILCPPVGVHDGVAALIEHQALAACATLGVPSHSAAILVAGHGSASAPGRALALHRHAARVAATGYFARVEAACLEEAPFVADALASLRAHPVIVIGFFASGGAHVRDDLPALIATEQAERGHSGLMVRFHGCVSDDPMMTEIILDQATSGSGRK